MSADQKLVFRWCAAFFIAGSVVASSARAVVVGSDPDSTSTPNTTSPGGNIPWANVGAVNNFASCIYLGNNWVLTVDHAIDSGNDHFSASVSFNGGVTNTTPDMYQRLVNPADGLETDMVLMHLPGSAPAGAAQLNLANAAPVIGAGYTNVGFGQARNTAIQYYDANFNAATSANSTYSGFGTSGPFTKTWGTNIVANVGTMSAPLATTTINIGYGNLVVFGGEFASTTDQIVRGDSGGAVFDSNGTLVGMNDAIGTFGPPDQPFAQPDSTAIFGDESYMADISTYYPQIDAYTGVPEPSAVALGAIVGFTCLLRRNRRQYA